MLWPGWVRVRTEGRGRTAGKSRLQGTVILRIRSFGTIAKPFARAARGPLWVILLLSNAGSRQGGTCAFWGTFNPGCVS